MLGRGAESMEILKCKKGQTIIRQGEIATAMFEIVSGQVGIYMDYGDEAQKEIGILTEGDFVGELELIDSSVRIASAVALGNDVVVKKLTIEDFNELVRKNPAKVILIIQQLAGRVRRLDNLYLEACTTIDDMRTARENNLPASPSLLARLHKFAAHAKKHR